jgi:hypothetical protein
MDQVYWKLNNSYIHPLTSNTVETDIDITRSDFIGKLEQSNGGWHGKKGLFKLVLVHGGREGTK